MSDFVYNLGEKWQNTIYKRIVLIIAALLILGDLAYSFYQHYQYPLDGDMQETILPLDFMQPLYHDPFGIQMIIHHEPHAAPNRFFSHYLMYKTYRTIPFALQKMVDPVRSIYLTNAFSKILMQIALLLLLCALVCGGFRFKEPKFWIAMLLFTPLFQTNGATRSIGLIDPSITYSFFYALPLIFLVCCLLPFIYQEFFNKTFISNPVIRFFYYVIFLLLTCFSGAINTAITLVLIFTFLLRYSVNYFHDRTNDRSLFSFIKSIPKHYWLYLLPLGLLSLYSLWLGTFNTMWDTVELSLLERYKLLPKGFLMMFTNTGFVVFFILSVFNFVIISHFHSKNGKNVIQMFVWINVFALIYILLLPFGGYRPYRPYIIRYDVMIAVSFLYILFLVYSTLFLIENISQVKRRMVYLFGCLFFMLFFSMMDKPLKWDNDQEIAAIRQIQEATETPVVFTYPVTVVSWVPAYSVEESENASKLLYIWKITDTPKSFYCLKEEK